MTGSAAPAVDVPLLAHAWIDPQPFREGRIRSSDPGTQAALDALLAESFPGLRRVIGEKAQRVIDRAAKGGPFASRTAIDVDADAEAAGAGRLVGLTSGSYASVCAVLRDPATRAVVLGRGDIEFNSMSLMPTLDREPITPEMMSSVREQCELKLRTKQGKPLQFNKAHVDEALLQVAHEHPFHPVREYLRRVEWDGNERIVGLPILLGAPDTPLVGAMLRKFMIAAVARAERPGCKVDTTLVLIGPQGAGKSRFFRALAGPDFSDTPMTIGDKDSLLVLHSAWIHEWAELETYQRARSSNSVKAFLSSGEDVFRAPYERATRRYPRSCVIVGSTNDQEFLTDATGGRRYWVVPVTRVDVDAIAKVRDRLWAEAVAAFDAGEPWHLSPEEDAQLREAQRDHEVADPWDDLVLAYADSQSEGVTTGGVLDYLQVPRAQQNRAHEMRVAAILKRAGFEKRRPGAGERRRLYVRPERRTNVVSLKAPNLEVGHG